MSEAEAQTKLGEAAGKRKNGFIDTKSNRRCGMTLKDLRRLNNGAPERATATGSLRLLCLISLERLCCCWNDCKLYDVIEINCL